MNRRFAILVSLFAMGMLTITTQIYLIREFLNLFNGNELIIGIVLGNWLLLTGLGAWLGRYFKKVRGKYSFTLFLLILISLLPLVTLLKLDAWKVLVFPYGSMTGATGVLYSSFVVQLPFCLLNGFLFTTLSILLKREMALNAAGKAYAAEAAGSLAGGLLVSFLFLWLTGTVETFRIILVICSVNIILFSLTFLGWSGMVIATLIMGASVFGAWRLPIREIRHRVLFREQDVIEESETPYGRVVVTENADQLNFYENGTLICSTANEILSEESAHFALSQRNQIDDVLVIAGGVTGILQEVARHHPRHIDYVDLNPDLVRATKTIFGSSDSVPVRFIRNDGRSQLAREKGETYTAVLMNLPQPGTLELNRYYSLEFFQLVKKHLEPGGILSLSLDATGDYTSEAASRYQSSVYSTLGEVFSQVIVVPGQRNWYLASDSSLSFRIIESIESQGIQASYVNSFYFSDEALKDRSETITAALSPNAPLNRDFQPVAFQLQTLYWLTFFKDNLVYIAILGGMLLIVILMTLNPLSTGLFAGGFTSASLQVALLLSVQVLFGNIYSRTAIMVTLFMAGLAAGGFLKPFLIRKGKVKHFLWLQAALGIIALALPWKIPWLAERGFPGTLMMAGLCASLFIIAGISGLAYAVAADLKRTGFSAHVADNYSADLFGAAAGGILSAVILIPVLGFLKTGLVLALLNLLSVCILALYRKRYRNAA